MNNAIINAMSVDVEDWHNTTILQLFGEVLPPTKAVEKNTIELLEILDKYNAKATWFFLGEIAEHFPKLVRIVVDAGHEPGIHGYHHNALSSFNKDEFRENLRKAKNVVEQAGGISVNGFRGVDFGIDDSTMYFLEILAEEGFLYDSSIMPFSGMRYGMKNANPSPHRITIGKNIIYEIPVTIMDIYKVRIPAAGGGYFRLLPYRYSELLVRWANMRKRPAVVYLHPWELDTKPMLEPEKKNLGIFDRSRYKCAKIAQKFGRSRTRYKLERLLKKYKFGTLLDVYKIMLDSEKKPEQLDEVIRL